MSNQRIEVQADKQGQEKEEARQSGTEVPARDEGEEAAIGDGWGFRWGEVMVEDIVAGAATRWLDKKGGTCPARH